MFGWLIAESSSLLVLVLKRTFHQFTCCQESLGYYRLGFAPSSNNPYPRVDDRTTNRLVLVLPAFGANRLVGYV